MLKKRNNILLCICALWVYLLFSNAVVSAENEPMVSNNLDDTGSLSIMHRSLTDNQRAEQLYRQGVNALKANDISVATEALQDCLRLNVNHGYARQALIILLTQEGHLLRAIEVGENGLKLSSNKTVITNLITHLYLRTKQFRKVIRLISADQYDSGLNAESYALLAFAYLKLQDYKKSNQLYQEINVRYPHVTNSGLGLALSYEYMGELQHAHDAYLELTQKNTSDPDVKNYINKKIAALQSALD